MSPLDAIQIIESDDDDSIDMQDVVDAIQCLIDSAVIWELQGSYQLLRPPPD